MLLLYYSFNVGLSLLTDILFQYFISVFKYDVGIDLALLPHLYQTSGFVSY